MSALEHVSVFFPWESQKRNGSEKIGAGSKSGRGIRRKQVTVSNVLGTDSCAKAEEEVMGMLSWCREHQVLRRMSGNGLGLF